MSTLLFSCLWILFFCHISWYTKRMCMFDKNVPFVYLFFSYRLVLLFSQWWILQSRGTHKITFKFKSLQVYQTALSANTFPTSLIALSSADMQYSLTLGILWLESVPGKAPCFPLSYWNYEEVREAFNLTTLNLSWPKIWVSMEKSNHTKLQTRKYTRWPKHIWQAEPAVAFVV